MPSKPPWIAWSGPAMTREDKLLDVEWLAFTLFTVDRDFRRCAHRGDCCGVAGSGRLASPPRAALAGRALPRLFLGHLDLLPRLAPADGGGGSTHPLRR